MSLKTTLTGFAALTMLALPAGSAWSAPPTNYTLTPLVSDQSGQAPTTDPHLLNSWGLAFFPTFPFWVNDNNAGVATLYDGKGVKQSLEVSIPGPKGSAPDFVAAPTGIVANGTGKFMVTDKNGSSSALFIFATEDGTISGWKSGNSAILVIDNSTTGPGAVYKGLALSPDPSNPLLFATNFRAGTVEVYDGNFNPVKLPADAFTDSKLPDGYAPFGIGLIGGNVYVTYALQNETKHDDVSGPAHGFVDVFTASGTMVSRFAMRGHLNSPWGITTAPAKFGEFSNDILIGNFGDGAINAFTPSGKPKGLLKSDKKTLKIDGLWALVGGANAMNANANGVYFTAGPNGEKDGLFGVLTAGQ